MTTTPRPSDGPNAAVAAVLNGERTSAGLTFEELSKRTGISKRTLMRLLSTLERDIDVNVLADIAAVFNLTPAETMAMAEERQRRMGGA